MAKLKEIKIVFFGIDEWNRPIFREVYEQDGKYWYKQRFFGDTDHLYREAIDAIKDYKKGTDNLCYFGQFFGCEPCGDKPEALGVKLIFDADLSHKILDNKVHIGIIE